MIGSEGDTPDLVDLLRALRDALQADVRRTAIISAISATLCDECTPLESAMVLRRLAVSKNRRRRAS